MIFRGFGQSCWVSFSFLTASVGWQKASNLATASVCLVEKPGPLIRTYFSRTCGPRKSKDNRLTQIQLENRRQNGKTAEEMPEVFDCKYFWRINIWLPLCLTCCCRCCCIARSLQRWITFLCYWVSAAGTKRLNHFARGRWLSGRRWGLCMLNCICNNVIWCDTMKNVSYAVASLLIKF